VGTKNLLSNGISYSSAGGGLAGALRGAGLDALVITGQAQRPVYLHVDQEGVHILPAGWLWGLSTWETEEALRQRYGEPALSIGSIGPAGENLVRIACLMVDGSHAAAWGGVGAILGAKNLKAIAAPPSSPNSAPSSDFLELARRLVWKLKASEAASVLRRAGTHGMAAAGGWSGGAPASVRNLQDEYWPVQKNRLISETAFKAEYEVGRTGCPGCFIRCLHLYRLPNGRLCEGMHANSVRGFGPNWDVCDRRAILEVHAACNALGLDVDGTSATVAWAMEGFEHGWLSAHTWRGSTVRFGDSRQALKLVRQIAHREGLGDLLAEGVSLAAQQVGGAAVKAAMHVKGVGINEQALRSHRAWALGVAVSTRGGGHLGGSPQTENRQLSAEAGASLFGCPAAGDPTAYTGKERLVYWFDAYKAVIDCLGLCYLVYGWYDVALADPGNLCRLLKATGTAELSEGELLTIGHRIVNVERAFNTLHGRMSRRDDYLPERVMSVPVSGGIFSGCRIDRDAFDAMLTKYYALQGWDPATGLQRLPRLQSLGLESAWWRLHQASVIEAQEL